MINCFKCGLIWQGLTHDLSKFSPTEFIPGSIYYTGDRSPIDTEKMICGYSDAWQHHKGRNRHHWAYWTEFREGKLIILKMPPEYVLEMLCDWISVSKTRNEGSPWHINILKNYYNDHKEYMLLHPNTKTYIDLALKYSRSEDELFHNWMTINRVQEVYDFELINCPVDLFEMHIYTIGIDLSEPDKYQTEKLYADAINAMSHYKRESS
jgi:hypothetical protein